MTQGDLEKIPQGMERLLRDLEVRIMEDMVRRIRQNAFSTASADWQFTRLQQLGQSEKDIKAWVKELLHASDEEIERIYSEDVYKEYMTHGRGYQVYGRQQIPFEDNVELQQLIEGVKQQTADQIEQITGSMGFVTKGYSGNLNAIQLSEYYQDTLDRAVMDLHSGAFDYSTVLNRTINEMTRSGLRWIDYESGWHNRVPVAARRAVMTGFRQVQGKINEQTARDLGTDSYEVTVHIGARPSHQVWEGKVYTMEQLHSVCGLGTGAGLHGWNCYHDYNAFIPGVDVRTYTDEQLDEIHEEENTPRTYQGKEYTTYEALQRQRQLETRARKYREDIHLLEEGDGSEDDIIAKKCQYQKTLQEYNAFSKKMGLPMQKERIYQDGLKVDGRVNDLPKAKPSDKGEAGRIARLAERQARKETLQEMLKNSVTIGSPYTEPEKIMAHPFSSKFSRITENSAVNNRIRSLAQGNLTKNNGSYTEMLDIIDLDTGDSIIHKSGMKNDLSVSLTPEERASVKGYKGRIIGIHNHPTNIYPTGSDFVVAAARKYDFGIVVTHDLRVFRYTGPTVRTTAAAIDDIIDYYTKTAYTEIDKRRAFVRAMDELERRFGITWQEI